jgi:hypothetical protein
VRAVEAEGATAGADRRGNDEGGGCRRRKRRVHKYSPARFAEVIDPVPDTQQIFRFADTDLQGSHKKERLPAPTEEATMRAEVVVVESAASISRPGTASCLDLRWRSSSGSRRSCRAV